MKKQLIGLIGFFAVASFTVPMGLVGCGADAGPDTQEESVGEASEALSCTNLGAQGCLGCKTYCSTRGGLLACSVHIYNGQPVTSCCCNQ